MTTPGREVMSALKDAGPDYVNCVWCGANSSIIGAGADLCTQCRAVRKADKKDVAYCRGGCGKKLLWQYLRCGQCREQGAWDERYSANTNQGNPEGLRRPYGKNAPKRVREIEAYYHGKGESVPWRDVKPSGGTWS